MPQPSFKPTHVSADVRLPRRSTFATPSLHAALGWLSPSRSPRACLSSTKPLQPCATLLVEDKLLQAKTGHDGETTFISQYIRAVLPGTISGSLQPHYWAKSNTYSNAPVSNRAPNTTNGILRFLMTCRAADFNDTGFVSSAVHQVDTWLPADFSAGTYQILTVTQHGYRHVITLKSTAFIREIATKTLPLHYKPITNQSAMFALTTSYCRGRY